MNPAIIPAIIPESEQHLADTLSRINTFATAVQVDIVDGNFVPFVSWPYQDSDQIEALKQFTGTFEIEVDLMVREPENVLFEYIRAGVRRAVVHLESTDVPEYILEHRREHEYLLGFSINNDTELGILTKYIQEIDFVQLMGIADIGSQGQPFDERVLERIHALRTEYPKLPISIDGSVNRETLPLLKKAGATRFVSGSAILKAENPAAAYTELTELTMRDD